MPAWLILGGVAIAAILVLHMRRRRQLDVPSVLLWRAIENTGAPRRTLRWPPPSILLALQILVVALVSLALAQPLFGGSRGDADHTVYVLDASASMRATDVAPDRFGNAVNAVTAQINGIDPEVGERYSVLLVDANPRILLARQTEPQAIASALEGLAASDGPANWTRAGALVLSLLAGEGADRVVVVTDGSDPAEVTFSESFSDVDIERVVIGEPTTVNLGLTATLLENNAEQGEWLVAGTVTFTGVRPPAEVTVSVLFRPEGADRFIEWGETESRRTGAADDPDNEPIAPATDNFAVDLQVPGPGTIRVALPSDRGPADNHVDFILRAAPQTARVLYLGPQSLPLVAALQSLGTIDLVEADALPENDAQFDLVIVDNVAISRRPATNVIWIGSAGLASASAPTPLQTPSISGWNTDHPLAAGVSWASLELATGYRVPRLGGSTVLLESGGVPLIQARTTPMGREVSVAIDLASSNWPELASFPVFVSSLVNWLGLDLGTEIVTPCFVGRSCTLEARLLGGTVVDESGNEVWSIDAVSRSYLLPGIERSFVPGRAGHYTLEGANGSQTIVVWADAAGEVSLTAIDGPAALSELPSEPPRVWWLLLVAALLLLLVEMLLAGRGSEHFLRRAGLERTNPLARRRRTMLAVRLVSISFLVAAVAGMPWIGREPAEDTVLVMGSALAAGDQTAERNDLIQQYAEATEGGARGGLITAGNRAEITGDLDGNTAAGAGAQAGANLEDGLLLAAALVPTDRTARIVLATDGNETEGDLARAVATLAERGIAVDIKPMTEIPRGEVLVEQINAPPRVYSGDIFPIEAIIYAQQSGPANVTVNRAGETVLSQAVELLAGRTMIETYMPAGDEGNLLIEVAVTADGDTYGENNINGLMVEVQPPPAVLIVTPQPVLGEYFAQALTVQGRQAEIVTPGEAPTSLEGWLEYQSIVLMNVPAIEFSTDNQEFLEQAVRVHGRGLLILGGENSFGPGGYYQTPLEDLSPLSSRIEHEAPEVAVVFVLDRSSSMGGMIGDQTRLDIAKLATVTAVGLLHESARVGNCRVRLRSLFARAADAGAGR
jgi:hypothetical protein